MSILGFSLIGILIGWFAAILAQIENARGIRRLIGAGFLAAQVAGLFANNWALFGGLNLTSIGISSAGAIVICAAASLLLRRGDAAAD